MVISHQNKFVILFFVGIAVSGLMLRLKAKELTDDPSFKASRGWYEKWKRRHSVSMQTKTTLAQRLPADLEENVVRFHRFVIAPISSNLLTGSYALHILFYYPVKTTTKMITHGHFQCSKFDSLINFQSQ